MQQRPEARTASNFGGSADLRSQQRIEFTGSAQNPRLPKPPRRGCWMTRAGGMAMQGATSD
jgi:hypothetical protein